MIDLNLHLPYEKKPREQTGNVKIFTLDKEGVNEYFDKEHITHKFISRFHPKIMDYIHKNSIDPPEENHFKSEKSSKQNLPKLVTPRNEIESKRSSKSNSIKGTTLTNNQILNKSQKTTHIEKPKILTTQTLNKPLYRSSAYKSTLPQICYTKNIFTVSSKRDPKVLTAVSFRNPLYKQTDEIDDLCYLENERYIRIIQNNRNFQTNNRFMPPNSELKPLDIVYTKSNVFPK